MVGRDTPEPIRSGTPCKTSHGQAVVVEPRIPGFSRGECQRRVNDEPDMEAFIKWYMLKSLYFSRAIRSCLVFFVVIAVIGIAISEEEEK